MPIPLQVEFYATPDEQRGWLRAQLRPEIWMLCWRPTERARDPYCSLTSDSIEVLDFQTQHEDSLVVFIGHKSLAAKPVWRDTAYGKAIDFVRSQAIEFDACLVYRDEALLEGRIAIMSREGYRERGIECDALFTWFKDMRREFKRHIHKKGAVLTQRTTDGRLKEWGGVVVSEGAVAWRRSGRKLKQFPRGPVELDVRLAER